MKKDQISKTLISTYSDFNKALNKLNADEFEYAPDGKWSAGQQLEHLIKSTAPLIKGLNYPKFLISYKFGKANRPSRTFEALVERYKEKLTAGGKATAPYVPNKVSFGKKEKLQAQLTQNIEGIVEKLNKWDETQMDEFVFPHPLLGKITVREMMYFTIYHADHHRNLIKIYLKGV